MRETTLLSRGVDARGATHFLIALLAGSAPSDANLLLAHEHARACAKFWQGFAPTFSLAGLGSVSMGTSSRRSAHA